MATLERIDITPLKYVRGPGCWEPATGKVLEALPHIFFSDGEPWRAANMFARSKLEDSQKKITTVVSLMGHLKAYADWLELEQADWRHFPQKKRDRVLFRFRGFVISQRDRGRVSPATASARMAAVVQFYRWAKVERLIERRDYWQDQTKIVRFHSTAGLKRALAVQSSELAIPNTKRDQLTVEDGLLPITVSNRNILLCWLRDRNPELWLMSLLGFFSGARSETIRTLRLFDLQNAYDDPMKPAIKCINVGPGTRVKTKFNVAGHIMVPESVQDVLCKYAVSMRRLKREALASKEDKSLLLLTRQGNPYSETSFTKLWSDLREKLVNDGLTQFKYFKFHQSRSTFGTELMKMAMKALTSNVDAIAFVRDAMLHKHERTTWKYVKFIEQAPIKQALSEEFGRLFFGTASPDEAKRLIEEVTFDVFA